MKFGALGLSKPLLEVVGELGFETLTPIQAQSIPLLLQGKDIIGQSQTGSGKTAAFTLPILEKIDLSRRDLQAVVLCPTRELCDQVAREIRKLGRRHPGFQVLVLSGGQPIYPQLTALEKGIHLAVGTPGRVRDHLKRKSLNLKSVATVVLDEADRMLDMGFEEDMRAILGDETLPAERQTALFSATYPPTIEGMSRRYQRAPVRVTIESAPAASATALSIRQQFYEAPDADTKLPALLWLLRQAQPESAIVFCNQKATVVAVTRALQEADVSAAGLQGDLEQSARDRVMFKFRGLSTRVLVATDVAARGIDIEDLDLVVNYDLSPEPEIYVHRIGRTGRAGRKGHAVSFGIAREKAKVEQAEKLTGTQIERKTLPPLSQLEAEAAKRIFERGAKMETLFIGGGRKDKVRPGDLLGALTGEAGGLPGTAVGKIEIHDRFAYVAVERAVAATALARLREGRIKGRKFRIETVR